MAAKYKKCSDRTGPRRPVIFCAMTTGKRPKTIQSDPELHKRPCPVDRFPAGIINSNKSHTARNTVRGIYHGKKTPMSAGVKNVKNTEKPGRAMPRIKWHAMPRDRKNNGTRAVIHDGNGKKITARSLTFFKIPCQEK